MIITIPPSVASDEDLVRIGEANQGYRVEREEDGTITMSPTHSETGSKSAEALGQLWLYAKTAGGKAYDSSTGFAIGPGKKVRSPDASWNSQATIDSLPDDSKQKFWRISPDVVIEVASESDDFKHTTKRIERFCKRGTKYAVAIDPNTRKVEQLGAPPPGLTLDFDAIIDA